MAKAGYVRVPATLGAWLCKACGIWGFQGWRGSLSRVWQSLGFKALSFFLPQRSRALDNTTCSVFRLPLTNLIHKSKKPLVCALVAKKGSGGEDLEDGLATRFTSIANHSKASD